MTSLRF